MIRLGDFYAGAGAPFFWWPYWSSGGSGWSFAWLGLEAHWRRLSAIERADRNGWVDVYIGRDMTLGDGLVALVQVLRSPELMRAREQHRRVLVGFELVITARPTRGSPWPLLDVRVRSDASEIATRMAARAGLR